MDTMKGFQGQLTITRRYIIGQLQQEIVLLQQELAGAARGSVSSVLEQQRYQKVISRKRRLIESLSCTEAWGRPYGHTAPVAATTQQTEWSLEVETQAQ